MTRDEIKEIYEAIAAAMSALEREGQDITTSETSDSYVIEGCDFSIYYAGGDWEARVSER